MLVYHYFFVRVYINVSPVFVPLMSMIYSTCILSFLTCLSLYLFVFIFTSVCVCIPFLWASRPKPPRSERIDWFIGGLSGSDWIYCPQTMFITQQRVMWAESAATREGRDGNKRREGGGKADPEAGRVFLAHFSPEPINLQTPSWDMCTYRESEERRERNRELKKQQDTFLCRAALVFCWSMDYFCVCLSLRCLWFCVCVRKCDLFIFIACLCVWNIFMFLISSMHKSQKKKTFLENKQI